MMQLTTTLTGIAVSCQQAGWPDGLPRRGNLMGAARHERHSLLERKCRELGIPSLMTAHHAGRVWGNQAVAMSDFGWQKARCPKSLSLCSLCNLLL